MSRAVRRSLANRRIRWVSSRIQSLFGSTAQTMSLIESTSSLETRATNFSRGDSYRMKEKRGRLPRIQPSAPAPPAQTARFFQGGLHRERSRWMTKEGEEPRKIAPTSCRSGRILPTIRRSVLPPHPRILSGQSLSLTNRIATSDLPQLGLPLSGPQWSISQRADVQCT